MRVPARHRAVPENAAIAVISDDPGDGIVVPSRADRILALHRVGRFLEFRRSDLAVRDQLLDGHVVAEQIVRPGQVAQRRIEQPVQFPALRYEARMVEAITLRDTLSPPARTEIFRSVCHGCPPFETRPCFTLPPLSCRSCELGHTLLNP